MCAFTSLGPVSGMSDFVESNLHKRFTKRAVISHTNVRMA